MTGTVLTNERRAEILLNQFKEVQLISEVFVMPCPRCGMKNMKTPASENKVSRFADVYICDECHKDEEFCLAHDVKPLSFSKWSLVFSLFD